jgi:hypothetical protein
MLKASANAHSAPTPLTVVVEARATPFVVMVLPAPVPDSVICPVYVRVSPSRRQGDVVMDEQRSRSSQRHVARSRASNGQSLAAVATRDGVHSGRVGCSVAVAVEHHIVMAAGQISATSATRGRGPTVVSFQLPVPPTQ